VFNRLGFEFTLLQFVCFCEVLLDTFPLVVGNERKNSK